MKHACTYQPGFAVIVSCWKAPWDTGPVNSNGDAGDELFESLFLPSQQRPSTTFLARPCVLDGKRNVHVHEEAFVFEAHEFPIVQRGRSAEGELDVADGRLRGGQRRRRGCRCDGEARVHVWPVLTFTFGGQREVLTGRQIGLRFARLAGGRFRVEDDRAVLARVVGFLGRVGRQEASTSATVTPGFSGNRIALASFVPVAVVTMLTAPDCVVPPTAIEVFVTASVSVGSVAACAAPAAIRLADASSAAAAASVARSMVLFTFACLLAGGARRASLGADGEQVNTQLHVGRGN